MAEVKFKFVGDDSELRKKLAGLAKLQAEMSDKFEKNLIQKLSGSSANPIKGMADEAKKSTTAVKQLTDEQKNLKAAQLENIESLRRLREERSKEISDLNILKQLEQDAKTVLAEKKAATEGLTQTEKELNIQYKQGQIELQAYTKELKEQAEIRRKVNAEERAAEKVLRDAERARKDAEREAEKAAKAAEKRRKQLEKENSEYYKLNTALGKVRKEARDVLAEMFRLEQAGHKTSLGYEMLRKRSEELVEQTNILDAGIKKIDAQLGIHFRNVGNYQDALENLSPAIANINQKLSMFGTSLEELSQAGGLKAFGASLVNIGTSIGKFLISPVGIAVVVLTSLFMLFSKNKQTVIDFNDGLLNVSKTTGLTGSALQSFSDDIISLSRSLKTVSTDKLLEYASVAGQLGVKGSQNILAFSEALAKLETASDISGEEGASQIARLLQLVDGGVGNIKAFGDEIVQLGNNFPATESEILANATRIAQSTGIYKLGRQEILAYATATKSVGVEAELVGSTLGRTLGTLEKAIRSGKGVDEVLRLVGGTQAELGNRFREDASGVLMDFIGGLNRTSTTASDFNKSLEAVGITAQRDRDVIGSLASKGYATLADAMGQVKDATGSMDAEFGTASEKLINQSERISIAWNNFVLGIENGQGSIGKASVAVISFVADTIDAISGNVAESDKLLDSYRKLESQTSSTEKSVRPLLRRYDELKSKTTLNKDEHTELREIIKRVSELIPSAVTEFDKYGQAIDINKKKITQFNDAQKQLVKDMNITARKTLNMELDELKRQRDQITSVQNNSLNNEKGTSFISRLARIGLSDEKRLQGIQDRTEKIAVITDKIKSNLQKQRDLGGTLSPQDRAFMSQFDPANSSTTTNSNKQEEVVRKNKEYWEKIVTDTQEAIDALEVSQKGSDIWNSLSKKLAEAQKNVDKYSLSKDESAVKSAGKAAEETRRATERQRSLQLEIDKINETASRNQISRNESELASVKDKYAKIKEEVRKFYADPKNKGLRVDESGLRRSENFEVSEATTRQDTKSLTESLAVQKQLLDEYNAYAEQTSKEEADKRYAGQLASFKGYKDRLQKEYMDLITLEKSSASSDFQGSAVKLTQAQEERAKALRLLLDSLDKEERERGNRKLVNALQSAKSLNDKLIAIEKDYQDDLKALRDANDLTPEREEKLTKKRDLDVSKTATSELTGSIQWETLFSNMDIMGAKEIRNLLSIIEKDFNSLKGKFDPVDLERIKKQLKEAENILIEKNPFGEFGQVVKSAFEGASDEGKESADDIKTNWRKLAKATAKSFDFVAEAVHSASFLKEALGDAGDAALATLDAVQITATAVAMAIDQAENASVILAIIKAALAVVQAVFSFIDGAAKKRNEALKKEQEYYEALSETFDILIEKQKELFSVKSGKSAMDAYNEALELVNSKTIANRKSLEAWFSQGASLFKRSNWYKYDKELGDVLSRQKLLNMSSEEWQQLLLKQPTLWAKLPEEVKKFGQSMIDAKEQAEDLKDAIKEALTGISLDDIKDEFGNLFSQADLTFGDISDSFYKHMQKAVLRLVQDGKMTESMQSWYDNVLKAMDDGDLTKTESDTLKAEYKALAEAGNKRYQAMMDLIGYDGDIGGSGLKSSIQRELTEATASELTGLYRSTFELNKRMFDESKSQGLTLSKQVIIATDQLAALNAIQTNTFNTVSELKNAVGELKSINKNLGGRY
ncbi:phage tail tape measure protein [Sphingobacterium multivorum]|uniref:phage tail tape measure protein n=1 Tax=Sphingobacterium multivorum TaxID=28454 RepID=UPI0028AA9EA6|nr:phage tail tape measure protein [Sphingobacterium multivorum]